MCIKFGSSNHISSFYLVLCLTKKLHITQAVWSIYTRFNNPNHTFPMPLPCLSVSRNLCTAPGVAAGSCHPCSWVDGDSVVFPSVLPESLWSLHLWKWHHAPAVWSWIHNLKTRQTFHPVVLLTGGSEMISSLPIEDIHVQFGKHTFLWQLLLVDMSSEIDMCVCIAISFDGNQNCISPPQKKTQFTFEIQIESNCYWLIQCIHSVDKNWEFPFMSTNEIYFHINIK